MGVGERESGREGELGKSGVVEWAHGNRGAWEKMLCHSGLSLAKTRNPAKEKFLIQRIGNR